MYFLRNPGSCRDQAAIAGSFTITILAFLAYIDHNSYAVSPETDLSFAQAITTLASDTYTGHDVCDTLSETKSSCSVIYTLNSLPPHGHDGQTDRPKIQIQRVLWMQGMNEWKVEKGEWSTTAQITPLTDWAFTTPQSERPRCILTSSFARAFPCVFTVTWGLIVLIHVHYAECIEDLWGLHCCPGRVEIGYIMEFLLLMT